MSSVHDDQLLAIGPFGRRSGLSVKALRHYDRLGLLPAAYVDAADLLRTHRTRLEVRLVWIHGDLHIIDHYLTGGMDLGMAGAIDNDPMDLGDERKLAVNLFNSVWDLMGSESRSTAQDGHRLCRRGAGPGARGWRRRRKRSYLHRPGTRCGRTHC